MPIFEYKCKNCSKVFSLLEGVGTIKANRACPVCKSSDLQKLISMFSTSKSEEARLEALADPSNLTGIDENDPSSIAKWAKKMGKAMGEDMGDEIDEMIEQEISGQSMSNPVDDKIY